MMRYKLGLDIGSGSVGWGVINLDAPRIESLGVRVFPASIEDQAKQKPFSWTRRSNRSARRTLKRKQQRMKKIKSLLFENGIITKGEYEKVLKEKERVDVWQLRVEALERKLSPKELARVLVHLAKRRGYKVNKNISDDVDGKDGKMTAALKENKRLLEDYQTVGEMVWKDDRFKEHKRNKKDNYISTFSRYDIEVEIHKIFEQQRRLGNQYTTNEVEQAYAKIWSFQRPFATKEDIERKVGNCAILSQFKRTPKATYAFQYFSVLDKLNSTTLLSMRGGRKFTDEEKASLLELAKSKREVSYSNIRTHLGLSDDSRFKGLVYDPKKSLAKNESVTLFSMSAYIQIKEIILSLYGSDEGFTQKDYDTLGYALTVCKDNVDLVPYLLNEYVSPKEKLVRNHANRKYELELIKALSPLSFNKFGHLSRQILQRIIPHLEQGKTYTEAIEVVGLKEQAQVLKSVKAEKLPVIKDVKNPIVMRSLSQCRKVINAIIRKYGVPVSIHIEYARDTSKTPDKRAKILKQFNKNRKINKEIKDTLTNKDHLKREPSGRSIEKYKLWKEQNGTCYYSLNTIPAHIIEEDILKGKNHLQIDHIIPLSQSFDNSYSNKILVYTKSNQDKRKKLPAQYFKHTKEWEQYKKIVKANKNFSVKKKENLLRLTFEPMEEGFSPSALNATSYATVYLAEYIKERLLFAPGDNKQKVFTPNGRVTSYLRKRWGFNKNREDSLLHHAVDAVITAATTQSFIERVTKHLQDIEDKKYKGKKPYFPEPWPGFRKELQARITDNPKGEIQALKLKNYDEAFKDTLSPIFVSRMPLRKMTGQAHEETKRGIVGKGEGKFVTTLKTPLEEIKFDKEGHFNMYGKESDPVTYNSIRNRYLEHSKNKNKAFIEPLRKTTKSEKEGPLIKSVKIVEEKKSGIEVNGFHVHNGKVLRVDVYRYQNKNWFQPIYTMDLNKETLPVPTDAKGNLIPEDAFCFSLFKNDLLFIELGKKKSYQLPNQKTIEIEEGYFYFQSYSQSDGRMVVKLPNRDQIESDDRINIKSLPAIRKCQVDMLGNISFTGKERRRGI